MFEKFTQKAISIIQTAQDKASALSHNIVYSEHILLAAIAEAKGVDARIFENAGIDFRALEGIVLKKLDEKPKYPPKDIVPFSRSAKLVLEKTIEIYEAFKSPLIMPQHIYLALVSTKNTGAYNILKECESDSEVIVQNFEKLISKKKPDTKHPEEAEQVERRFDEDVSLMFKEEKVKNIFSNAISKLSAPGYEILGTEQIFQSLLECQECDVVQTLAKQGIDRESFAKKLEGFSSRQDEYGEKEIIFTPNAFRAMLLAIEAAKENGSVEMTPEYIILGLMRAKRGIAYKILKDLAPPSGDFEEIITKHLVCQTPETLSILRHAKSEAQAMGKNTIGTELVLLGILDHKTGIGAITLSKLGISANDVRDEIRKQMNVDFLSWETDTSIKNFTYTPRAKKLLEIAFQVAKRHKKPRIMSENLLYAIAKQPDCLAMKILISLGTDAVEVAQGIVHQLYAGPSSLNLNSQYTED